MSERESPFSFACLNALLAHLGGWRIGQSGGHLALLRVEGAPHQIVFSRPWESF